MGFAGHCAGSDIGGGAVQRASHVGLFEVPSVVGDVERADALHRGVQAAAWGSVVLLFNFLRGCLVGQRVTVADEDQALGVIQILEILFAYPEKRAAQISHDSPPHEYLRQCRASRARLSHWQ
ncbi:hypothetical protein D3C77_633370 [compost metagenome]